ncbi:MAG TPA: hypothetical protein P5055_07645 [Candidatus Paceibacterota bacterium]|nr:hypothetical protein [Candidatus Paceibacterota bacterium]
MVFAEALELAKMERFQSDPAIADVRNQLRSLRAAGHEIGLHLHPWWANARFEDGSWSLDWSERNICALPTERIDQIVTEAINYLRNALGDPAFSPVSFRGGLWLMQPTVPMASVLACHSIQVDSSAFKGGRTRDLGLDYRPALQNGPCWRFSTDVNFPDSSGSLLEFPIHSEMVPFWAMLGRKRLRIQKKVPAATNGTPLTVRWLDYLRLRYPRKLDFCRMTAAEMCTVMKRALQHAHKSDSNLAPVVAIGHSKDLVDMQAVRTFLDFLHEHSIPVTTFHRVLPHCL